MKQSRLNRLDTERSLAKIRVGALINRLQKHALGELRGSSGGANELGEKGGGTSVPAEMSDSQVRSACFLIDRLIARAENPRDINVTGHISLESLIAAAAAKADDRPDADRHTAH